MDDTWVLRPDFGGSFHKVYVNSGRPGLEMAVGITPSKTSKDSPVFCVEEKIEFFTRSTKALELDPHWGHSEAVFEGIRFRDLFDGFASVDEAEMKALSYLHNEFDPQAVDWNDVSVVDPTVTEGWVERGSMLDAADAGGDDQVGRAWDRRFHHPDKPGCLLTVYLYAVRVENDAVPAGFELGIQKQTEYMICGDTDEPGDTEVWSTYTYEVIDGYNTLGSVDAAEIEAHDWLKKLDAGDLSWNGVRF